MLTSCFKYTQMQPKLDELLSQTKSRFRTIRGSLGSDGCCFGQIAGLDYLCNPFRERFKKITQQTTRYKRLAMQRLQSVHHTEVGYILKREYTKNRPEKCETLRSETRSRLCRKGVLETQFEELLMSIKRQEKSLPFTLILLYHPWYKFPLPF